ncbi:704_t:CDS:2, partial [Paraglomus brasilianum]
KASARFLGSGKSTVSTVEYGNGDGEAHDLFHMSITGPKESVIVTFAVTDFSPAAFYQIAGRNDEVPVWNIDNKIPLSVKRDCPAPGCDTSGSGSTSGAPSGSGDTNQAYPKQPPPNDPKQPPPNDPKQPPPKQPPPNDPKQANQPSNGPKQSNDSKQRSYVPCNGCAWSPKQRSFPIAGSSHNIIKQKDIEELPLSSSQGLLSKDGQQ